MVRVEHQISDWRRWGEELDAAVRAFHAQHGRWPDLVAASAATLRRVAIAATARPDHVRDDAGRAPEGFAPIRRFASEEYDVPLVTEDGMEKDCYALVAVAR